MQLILRIDGVETDDTDKVEELELLCVSKKRYGSVELCFRGGGWNIPFAKIKLYDSNLAIDADATFESALFLGDEICRRWNLQNEKIAEAINCVRIPVDHELESMDNNPLLKSFLKTSVQ
ncbi:hypothetical protein [Sulfuricurvum sp.]|uniref:hypothetical protein n=1 Tax=Sulfuricurvum sp. TaxID=2025608 RepID=UPI003BB222FC